MYSDKIKERILSAGLLMVAAMATAAVSFGQTTPAPESNTTVTSSVEFGYRGAEVNGNHEKFRSDLNYRAGVRIFDSSFLIESKDNFFDSALITASGWGSDPQGSFGLKLDKTGIYKFDSKVRRVTYFNNLATHAFNWSQPNTGSEHRSNTDNTFGDFDLRLRPESKTFRVNMGASFSNARGPGSNTIRFPAFTGIFSTQRGDEFQVDTLINSKSTDFRLGVEGQLAGFDVGLNYGHRVFTDRSTYFVNSFNAGNGPDTSTAAITSYNRAYNTKGSSDYYNLMFHRSVAQRFELTGRLIYSLNKSNIREVDTGTGIGNGSVTTPGIFVDLDAVNVTGIAKRPQTRGDIGTTFRVTNNFRISDTFNFDQFAISGGNRFLETFISRTNTGGVRPTDNADTVSARATSYRRLANTIEADLQVNRSFAFHVGYRYTKRRVGIGAFDKNLLNNAIALDESDVFENTTHTFLAGAKIKPTKNWSIFADIDRGSADNVFTRLANANALNFRIRSITNLKNLRLNLSFITKDNDNPGTSLPILGVAATDTVAKSKARIFSGSVEWTPESRFTLSTGYTYNRVDSNIDVIVPLGSPVVPATSYFIGSSRYFSRDSYFYFDINARPIKRLSIYASYRIDRDPGQGNLVAPRAQDIYSSYPMRFQTPEVRIAIRLSRNVDWNLGYQYYSYSENPIYDPFAYIVIANRPNVTVRIAPQNYTAHLPYTSLRIYFGRDAGDR
ncbi:MAG: hypothetical protein ABJA02_15795 [Acidobacteriota bacterium]